MRKTSSAMRSWSRNLAAKLDSYTHENTTLLRIYDYEHELFKIDQNLAGFRDLKEMYIDFNNKYVGLQILWITTKSKF